MPGVPPDALAQVKRGLKGLFNRKKRDNAHQTTQSAPAPTKTTDYSPASNSGTPTTTHSNPPAPIAATAPIAAASTTTELPTASSPPLPAAPLPSEPDLSTRTTASAPSAPKPADLPHSNPATTTTTTPHVPTTTTTHAVAPAAAIAPTATTAIAHNPGSGAMEMPAPTTTARPVAHGMSATSGPLDDQLAHGYEDEGEGTPFATPMEAPKRLEAV